MILHLALQLVGCPVWMLAERGTPHLSCILIPVDELQDGNITFEATLLSYFLEACTNDRPMESSKSRMGREGISNEKN